MERWVEETLHDGFRVRLKVDKVLLDGQTDHQQLIIFDNEDFGRVMMLDGVVQVSTRDEFVYHEMMAHVPLFAHGKAKTVLVVGGGDGGVLREVLRHPQVKSATLCEIDRSVIDLCRAHFPEISQEAYDDKRTRVVIADGTKFVAETKDRFDAILVDSTDPIGPGTALYTDAFYKSVRDALVEGGAATVQGGSFWYHPEVFQTVCWGLKSAFPVVKPMECFTAVYPGGIWNLFVATLGADPEDVNEARADGLRELDWYSARRHRAAFGISPRAERVLEHKPPPLDVVSSRLRRLTH